MDTLRAQLIRAARTPSLIPRSLKARALSSFRRYILKDEFTLAVQKWIKDQGDTTLRLDYQLTPDSIVVDLGGYKGDFAAAISTKYKCSVYVFEPVKLFFLECQKRFKGEERIHCFNYGLSDIDGSFTITNNNDGSSLIKSQPGSVCEEKVIVKCFSKEMERLQIENIDLLKINVEGAEFPILTNILASGMASKIKHFQVQFHNFYPNASILRERIRSELATTHTEDWNYPFVWESWTRKT